MQRITAACQGKRLAVYLHCQKKSDGATQERFPRQEVLNRFFLGRKSVVSPL